jgi:hypothetical protein
MRVHNLSIVFFISKRTTMEITGHNAARTAIMKDETLDHFRATLWTLRSRSSSSFSVSCSCFQVSVLPAATIVSCFCTGDSFGHSLAVFGHSCSPNLPSSLGFFCES